MTSGENQKGWRWLAVTAAVVIVAVIVAVIVTLRIAGSGSETASSTMPSSSITPKPVETTPVRTKSPNPVETSPVRIKSPKPARPAAPKTPKATPSPIPEKGFTPPARPAVEQDAPVPASTQCPSGAVSAHLTSVAFEVSAPAWEGDTFIEVTVTAHGVFTNGTSAPLAVDDADIPNFLGLDERGDSPVMELYGTYDSPPPPPGEPNLGEFVLEPGASVAYTAVTDTYADAIRQVKYWQADNDGYVLYYPFRELISCPVNFMAPAGAQAIPNTFAG